MDSGMDDSSLNDALLGAGETLSTGFGSFTDAAGNAVDSVGNSVDSFVSSIVDSPSSNGSKKVADSQMDGNSLIAALAGDAATFGGAYLAADVAKTTVKKNPGSANTLILAAAGVAALVVLVIVLKK